MIGGKRLKEIKENKKKKKMEFTWFDTRKKKRKKMYWIVKPNWCIKRNNENWIEEEKDRK